MNVELEGTVRVANDRDRWFPRNMRIFEEHLASLYADPDLGHIERDVLLFLIASIQNANLAMADVEDVQRACRIGKARAYQALKVLREKHLIERQGGGMILVNRQIAWRGGNAMVWRATPSQIPKFAAA